MKLLRRIALEQALCIGLAARMPVLWPQIVCQGRIGRETRPRLGRIGQRSA
ncbi:MAG: hypothetical protein WAW39_16040 [Prosthecobacter sp.]|uniref:hypothetical protein n=1 Tax=Prosthecobacter sp. TaxID=1965333 RepID=UPI003BAE71F2